MNTFIINKLWRIGKFQYHYKMPMLIHNIDTCVYYMFVFTCMSRDLQTHTFQHLHLAKVHIYKAYYHIRCRHTCGLIFTSLTSSKCILDIQYKFTSTQWPKCFIYLSVNLDNVSQDICFFLCT